MTDEPYYCGFCDKFDDSCYGAAHGTRSSGELTVTGIRNDEPPMPLGDDTDEM